MKQFIAVKAVIRDAQGNVLLLRESPRYKEGTNIGKFDFPGGRLAVGENWDEALLRETKEETGLDIEIIRPIDVGEWRPKPQGEEWQVIGIFFLCAQKNTEIKMSYDHTEFLWIDPKEYTHYPIIKNLTGVFEKIKKL